MSKLEKGAPPRAQSDEAEGLEAEGAGIDNGGAAAKLPRRTSALTVQMVAEEGLEPPTPGL